MTSTTAQAILASASAKEMTNWKAGVILDAILPVTREQNGSDVWTRYYEIVQALYNRDEYDEHGVEYAAIMLEVGAVLGDRDAYQVSEEGSIGLDPALAVEPEREAWDARARDIAERMAQAELDAHAETVARS